MIKEYSLKQLEKAINFALTLDAHAIEKLSPLDGKVIQIIISPLESTFFIRFNQHELNLIAFCETPADTVIHSSPLGLIRLSLLPSSKVRSLFNDQIKITGDVELGQAIKKLFDSLEIDWEGHLAHFTGDVIAHQVGSVFRRSVTFMKRTQSSFCEQVSDYVHEELKIFPPKEEVDDFYHEIELLALHVERLEAHINHYLARHETL